MKDMKEERRFLERKNVVIRKRSLPLSLSLFLYD
jgi:hypothetical protein